MNIINSLEWRYATKKFNPSKKLSIQQIETLKKAFNLTPTSFGLQPIKMIVISNKELQEKFVEHSYFQRQVADASHLLVLCIENDTTSEDINSYFDLEKEIRGTDEAVISKFRNQLVEMYQNKTIEDIAMIRDLGISSVLNHVQVLSEHEKISKQTKEYTNIRIYVKLICYFKFLSASVILLTCDVPVFPAN